MTDRETAKGTVEVQELTRLQQAVARRMAESKATVPELVLGDRAEMPHDAGPADAVVVRAAGLALREFPRANGAYRDGRFELYSRVNVGVAMAAAGALMFPTVFDADRKPLDDIAGELRDLAARAQAGTLAAPEVGGATFTVHFSTARRITPVINPPQAAALGVGGVQGSTAQLTLVCDHRILYGDEAAGFLARIVSGIRSSG
jgi:pyruvate dehydrogenase E2 component (dihydrolipoamide acetyltransferase)